MAIGFKVSNNSLQSASERRCLGAVDIREYSWYNEDAVNNDEIELNPKQWTP